MDNDNAQDAQMSNMRIVLSPQDLKIIKRLRKEERERYISLLSSLLVSAFLLYFFWEAPFAMHRLEQLPYSEASISPFYETRFMMPWLVGVFIMRRAIYTCFFDRRRSLILRLTKDIEQYERRLASTLKCDTIKNEKSA